MNDLIKEYKNLPDTWRNKKRRREIEEELKIFPCGQEVIVSPGTVVTLLLINTLFKGYKDRIDRFIEAQKKKMKNKNYPAQDWINTALKIKQAQEKYGGVFYFDKKENLHFRHV